RAGILANQERSAGRAGSIRGEYAASPTVLFPARLRHLSIIGSALRPVRAAVALGRPQTRAASTNREATPLVGRGCDEPGADSDDADGHRLSPRLPPGTLGVEFHLPHEDRLANRRERRRLVRGAANLGPVAQPHLEGSGSAQESHVGPPY